MDVWSSHACDDTRVGVCGVPACALDVSVQLDLTAGSLLPANTAISQQAGALRYPPVPYIALAAGQADIASDTSMEFDVTFTGAVSGLTGSKFAVSPLSVASTTLLGSAEEYTLTVDVVAPPACTWQCPAGFTALQGEERLWCARKSSTPTTMAGAAAACAPAALASVASTEHRHLLSGVLDSQECWCVLLP